MEQDCLIKFARSFPWRKKTRFAEKVRTGVKRHTIRDRKYLPRFSGKRRHLILATDDPCGCYVVFQKRDLKKVEWVRILPAKGIRFPVIRINGHRLPAKQAMRLAYNDGFDCPKDFIRWFKNGFEGLLIHWTGTRYF